MPSAYQKMLVLFHTDLMGGYQKSPAEALAPPINF